MRHRWQALLRDLFLITVALVVLYDQVFIASKAQALLIFLVIFLFGSVPAIRGDSKPGHYSSFARIVMLVLGVYMPESFEENEVGGGPSVDAGLTSSDSEHSAGQGRSSHSPQKR